MLNRNSLALVGLLAANAASGAIIASITEIGSDVFLDFEGSINVADLGAPGGAFINAGLHEPPGGAFFGGSLPSVFEIDAYINISGPSTFFSAGSADFIDADLATGDFFGIVAGGSVTGPGFYVPDGYISEAPLSGNATILNETLASVNLVEGIYTWTWGAGANADYFELTIGNPIPEPNAFALLAGVSALAIVAVRRR